MGVRILSVTNPVYIEHGMASIISASFKPPVGNLTRQFFPTEAFMLSRAAGTLAAHIKLSLQPAVGIEMPDCPHPVAKRLVNSGCVEVGIGKVRCKRDASLVT